MSEQILQELYEIAQARKTADPDQSYVAKLHKKGVKKISQKLGEEAVEAVIAAMRYNQKDSKKRREELSGEYADLLFHMIVLMAHQDIAPDDVFAILQERFGVSGLEEKSFRPGA